MGFVAKDSGAYRRGRSGILTPDLQQARVFLRRSDVSFRGDIVEVVIVEKADYDALVDTAWRYDEALK